MGRKSKPLPYSLFEIRLKGLDHDVVVFKGNDHNANPVLLSGSVVLSLPQSLSIKRVSLKLRCYMKLKWQYDYQATPDGQMVRRPFRFSRVLYNHDWNQLYPKESNQEDINNNIGTNKVTKKLLHSKSFSNFKKLTSHSNNNNTSSSSSSLSSSSHTYPEGNYEFPFQVILDGSIPESIEGNDRGAVYYKLEATIERSRLSTNIKTDKHLRVVKTLTPDSLPLLETVSVDNTWPNKVEYVIDIPAKAVAIGSMTPFNILMVPLIKGLKLGKITINLIEFSSFISPISIPFQDERIITSLTIPPPINNNNLDFSDKWEINDFLSIPASLVKCTQDSSVDNYIKINHRLKFIISLINPDNHVSELRASIPISLFISPNVSISTIVNVESHLEHQGEKDGAIVGNNETSNINTNENENENEIVNDSGLEEETLFQASGSTSPMNSGNNHDLETPPVYGNHIYDRLWSEVSSINNTPLNSGYNTPNLITPSRSRRQSIDGQSPSQISGTIFPGLSMTPISIPIPNSTSPIAITNNSTTNINVLELSQALAIEQQQRSQMSHSRQNSIDSINVNQSTFSFSPIQTRSLRSNFQNVPPPVPSGATYSHGNSDQYLASGGTDTLQAEHISRVGSPILTSISEIEPGSDISTSLDVDLIALSRVPSYETAAKSTSYASDEVELTPRYQESPINLINYTNVNHNSSSTSLASLLAMGGIEGLNINPGSSSNITSMNRDTNHSNSNNNEINNTNRSNRSSRIIGLLSRNSNTANNSNNTSPSISRNSSELNLQELRNNGLNKK